MEKKITKVGILLNHQDFDSAQTAVKEISQSIPEEVLAEKLSYEAFIALIRAKIWNKDEIITLITLREEYHPKDATRASFLTSKDRDIYWKRCESVQRNLMDEIDYAFCILFNKEVIQDKKQNYVNDLLKKDIINESNIQSISDF